MSVMGCCASDPFEPPPTPVYNCKFLHIDKATITEHNPSQVSKGLFVALPPKLQKLSDLTGLIARHDAPRWP